MLTLGDYIKDVTEEVKATSVFVAKLNEPIAVVNSEGKRIGMCIGDDVTQLKDLELIGSQDKPVLSDDNNYFDYAYNASTNTYRDRVVLDGGSIEELEEVNKILSGSTENLKFYISANAGIKKDANNLIEKAYSLDASNKDVIQDTQSYQPSVSNGFIAFSNGAHLISPPVITSLFGLSGLTVACWISVSAAKQPTNIVSTRYGAIIGQDYLGNYSNGYGIAIRDNKIIAQIRTKTATKTIESTTDINDGKLHRIVSVFNIAAGFLYLYIDGLLIGSIDFVVNSTDTTLMGSFKIARSNSDSSPIPLAGKIKSAEIWEESWDQTKITADFNNKPL